MSLAGPAGRGRRAAMLGPLFRRVDLQRRDAVLQQPVVRPAREEVRPDLAHAQDGSRVVAQLHHARGCCIKRQALRRSVHSYDALPVTWLKFEAFLFS